MKWIKTDYGLECPPYIIHNDGENPNHYIVTSYTSRSGSTYIYEFSGSLILSIRICLNRVMQKIREGE